jgi:hypothetical protein
VMLVGYSRKGCVGQRPLHDYAATQRERGEPRQRG